MKTNKELKKYAERQEAILKNEDKLNYLIAKQRRIKESRRPSLSLILTTSAISLGLIAAIIALCLTFVRKDGLTNTTTTLDESYYAMTTPGKKEQKTVSELNSQLHNVSFDLPVDVSILAVYDAENEELLLGYNISFFDEETLCNIDVGISLHNDYDEYIKRKVELNNGASINGIEVKYDEYLADYDEEEGVYGFVFYGEIITDYEKLFFDCDCISFDNDSLVLTALNSIINKKNIQT